MTTTDTSPADLIDFRLLNEAGQPALNIEEEGHTPVLRLEIENVSGQRLAFPSASRRHARKEEHHFSLSFRPGALSDETLARLSEADPSKAVLGPSAGDWDIRMEPSRRAIDPVTLYFLCTSRDKLPDLAPANNGGNSLLSLDLHHIAAAPGSGVRPTAAQLGITGLYEGNKLKSWLRLQRRAELYITHAQTRSDTLRATAPPLRLDLLDDLVIPVGHESKTVHLLLSNNSDNTIEGNSVELVMDIGEADCWWALASSGEFAAADYATLIATPVGGQERLEGPLEHSGSQGVPNALHWRIRLPNGRLSPGRGIDLRMTLKTTRQGPLAIHIVSDLIGLGVNRSTFLFPRLGTTFSHLSTKTGDLHNRTNRVEATLKPLPGEMKVAREQLDNHQQRIASLEAEVTSLKKTVQAQIEGLAQTTRFFLEESKPVESYLCDPGNSTLRTKSAKPESVTVAFRFGKDNGHVYGLQAVFSGSITPEQSPKPKDGAYIEFPDAKRGHHAFSGYWYYEPALGLLFEYEPISGRLYYHGRVQGIPLAEIPDHIPKWKTDRGGWSDWESRYWDAKRRLLGRTHWSTEFGPLDLNRLQGPY